MREGLVLVAAAAVLVVIRSLRQKGTEQEGGLTATRCQSIADGLPGGGAGESCGEQLRGAAVVRGRAKVGLGRNRVLHRISDSRVERATHGRSVDCTALLTATHRWLTANTCQGVCPGLRGVQARFDGVGSSQPRRVTRTRGSADGPRGRTTWRCGQPFRAQAQPPGFQPGYRKRVRADWSTYCTTRKLCFMFRAEIENQIIHEFWCFFYFGVCFFCCLTSTII